MKRFILILCACVAVAAEEPGWHFPLKQAVFYRYELTQTVSWRSSGDSLDYSSGMTWTFALRAIDTNGPTVHLNATIIRVQASLDGPAAEVRVDSRNPTAANDPVYGHLVGLAGITLMLTVDPLTGRVSAVSGGEEIIKQINARHPAAVPGDPPPLDATAKRLYSSEALAAWWSVILSQPTTAPEPLPLAPPLSGALTRTWNAGHFTVSLPEGVSSLPVTIVEGVNPVAGTLTAVTGAGDLVMADGLMAKSTGTLAYTLTLSALTQKVEQQHAQTWKLLRWDPASDPVQSDKPVAPVDKPAPPAPDPGVTHP
jgi:hypothetical protein